MTMNHIIVIESAIFCKMQVSKAMTKLSPYKYIIKILHAIVVKAYQINHQHYASIIDTQNSLLYTIHKSH